MDGAIVALVVEVTGAARDVDVGLTLSSGRVPQDINKTSNKEQAFTVAESGRRGGGRP
ncbi:MAG: hypothetical protein ACREA0_29320 [bacterium]